MNFTEKSLLGSFIISVIGLYGSILLIKRFRFKNEFNRLKLLRNNRKKNKEKQLNEFEIYLKRQDEFKNTDAIVQMDITKLLNYLKDNLTNQKNTLLAYQGKAFEVNSKSNAIVEFLDVDVNISRKGPLYGLPVSFKDNFNINGYLSYVGCSYFLQSKADHNAVLVNVIEELGGVPFVKTNVPQTMMSFLSSNPIDGVTLNPCKLSHSSGGSSSGEAALIAAGGSIVGFGTDIGGSVRLPAAFCGIVGFKPTKERLSKKGLLNITKISLVSGGCGILGRDVETVRFMFEKVVNCPLHYQMDPEIPIMNYNNSVHDEIVNKTKKLRIGYFVYDGSHRAVPAMERAVMESVDLLKSQGHELIPWIPPLIGSEWVGLYLTALGADKGRDLNSTCLYDEKDSSVKHLLELFKMGPIKLLLLKLKCYFTGENDRLIWLNVVDTKHSGSDILNLMTQLSRLRYDIAVNWLNNSIDGVLCPSAGFVAVPVRPKGSMTGMLSYLNLWNLVNFPAGTVPVSKVTKKDVVELKSKYPQHTSWHRNTYHSQLDSEDLPISVQIVTAPYKEEMCLAIMYQLQQSVNNK